MDLDGFIVLFSVFDCNLIRLSFFKNTVVPGGFPKSESHLKSLLLQRNKRHTKASTDSLATLFLNGHIFIIQIHIDVHQSFI